MPFRIGVLFTIFYLICFSVGALIFYNNMQSRVLNQLDRVLAQRYANIWRVYDDKGIAEVVRIVRITQSANPVEFGMGYQIVGPGGAELVGNLSGFEPQSGFYHVDGESLGFGSDSPKFRFHTNKLGDNVLTLGLNEKLLEDLRISFTISLLLTFLFTTVLALFGAMYLANRSQARIRLLSEFMGNVGKGDLNTRLPISKRSDEIDELSGNMNNAVVLLQQHVYGMQQVGANIAHDLKTPLSRLYIKLEEAVSMAQPEDPLLAKLEAASEDAAQINDTFEALLHISQLEAGAQKSQVVPTSLSQLLKKAYEVYDVVIEDNDQHIELDLEDNDLVVMGVSDLLLQLIVNLIENSIRHCPPQSKITLHGRMDGNNPWICVCDTGPGIPSQERERVFDRLYRLEKSRTTSGSGLGLSLVKVIADMHGAVLDLSDNEPGVCIAVKFDAPISQ